MRFFMWLFLLLAGSLSAAEEHTVSLEPGRQLILGTLVSGVVQKVNVQPGQTVRQGEVLLKLDQREFQARLRRAQSRVARANSLFDEALREEERAIELYDRTLLSDHELQKAQIGKLEAESRKHDAAADLVQARLDLERSQVKAPVNGRIVEVQAWPGQPVRNALRIQPLMVLASTDFLRFSVALSGRLAISSVQVRVDGQWRQVSGFRLTPEDTEKASWRLHGWLRHGNLAVGDKVQVRLE
ncbi:efflux RND transporter periplasmic adaptor subunit [Thiolapillus sp.]